MSNTTKPLSSQDFEQAIQYAFNDNTRTVGVGGFITAKVGHKITVTISTTNVANDTETYEYFDSSTSILQLKLIYTNGARTLLLSVERIA